MTQPRVGGEAYLDAQANIYRELGQTLFDMLDPKQQETWQRISLEGRQPSSNEAQSQSFRVTLLLNDGLEYPLMPRSRA